MKDNRMMHLPLSLLSYCVSFHVCPVKQVQQILLLLFREITFQMQFPLHHCSVYSDTSGAMAICFTIVSSLLPLSRKALKINVKGDHFFSLVLEGQIFV